MGAPFLRLDKPKSLEVCVHVTIRLQKKKKKKRKESFELNKSSAIHGLSGFNNTDLNFLRVINGFLVLSNETIITAISSENIEQ